MSPKRSQGRRTNVAVAVKIERDPTPEPDVVVEEEYIPDADEDQVSDDEVDEEFPKPSKRIKREPSGYRHPRRFNERWLTIEEVKDWVHPLKMDTRYVWCKFCKKKIRAHLADMKTHNKTRKHQRNLGTTIPEIPAEVPVDVEDHHASPSKANNIVITFPSQKDSSQEVIGELFYKCTVE